MERVYGDAGMSVLRVLRFRVEFSWYGWLLMEDVTRPVRGRAKLRGQQELDGMVGVLRPLRPR
jgi:hypothetical protein